MKAIIEGIQLEGTPEEISAFSRHRNTMDNRPTIIDMLCVLSQLAPVEISKDFNDKYYVRVYGAEIVQGSILKGGYGEHKPTKEQAIVSVYEELTSGCTMVINAMLETRKHYRFLNGRFVLV